ncbi:uncharacterized protein [Phaseolus vulgaris]|uniref:uncharacterized protein n=1 Tax=Phaseolus vulgaris TaxID=3885 RepID=UPI0035C95EA0
MSKYEEQMLQRIAENKEKLEALGLSHLAYSLKVPTQNTNNKKGKERDEDHDEEYRPKELEEFQYSSEDEKYNKKKITRPLRLNSKRVNASELVNVDQHETSQHVVKKRHGHTINAKLPKKREKLMKEELKSEEWPNAMEVWKATRMRSDGTWCIPNGEEIMENLKNVSEVYGEEI